MVSFPQLQPQRSTALSKRFECHHQRQVESTSLKNARTADEHSPATTLLSDTSRTNTNSPTRSTFVSFVIDDIERKTR